MQLRIVSIPALSRWSDNYAASIMVYAFVGGACACFEWASFYLLLGRTDIRIAALTGFLIATLVSYVLSRLIAFNSVRSAWQEAALVLGVSTLAYVFNFVIFLLVYHIGHPPMVAKIVGTGSAFAINYGLRQFFVFSRAPRFGDYPVI